MGENRLGINERRFLEVYRRFYGEDYPPSVTNNQNAHVKGQKAVYLLMQKHVHVGDYGFVWQEYGPCSDRLQDIMRKLDGMPNEVETFYHEFSAETEGEAQLYSDESNPNRIFWTREKEQIDTIKSSLRLHNDDGSLDQNGDTPLRRWMELLGSLTYISVVRLPGADESRVWEELIKAKSKAKYLAVSDKERETAFDVLRRAGLLLCRSTISS